VRRAWPIYYKGNPASVIGPGADVLWPAYTERLDFELEFGVFIGRQDHDISETEASSYIAGYTIFNDFSARDIQLRDMQGRLGLVKGKDFDTSNAMGPWLVTPDEIPNPYNLTMLARINGEEWSRACTGELQFSFARMISYISQSETLYPGDFIGVGTAPGGCGLEIDRWLQPGDVVELEVEGLGMLPNRVVRRGHDSQRAGGPGVRFGHPRRRNPIRRCGILTFPDCFPAAMRENSDKGNGLIMTIRDEDALE